MIVGQKLFYVPYQTHHRTQVQPYEVEVTKIGRKWVIVKNPINEWEEFRIDIKNGVADGKGYTSPGTCYTSREVWIEATQRKHYWNMFRTEISGRMRPPSQLSFERIKSLYDQAMMWGE